jgi:hypothetical protein
LFPHPWLLARLTLGNSSGELVLTEENRRDGSTGRISRAARATRFGRWPRRFADERVALVLLWR